MTRGAWFNDSAGHPQTVKAIWFKDSRGNPQKVKAAWFNDSHGHPQQWWPPQGGTPPGHVHTATLAGRRSGARWTFAIPAAAHGHITYATLIITARTMWSGNAVGWPSGGTLASNIHIVSGGGTAHRTVSAAKFNGATRGVTLHTTVGTTSAVTRVSLRITYTT